MTARADRLPLAVALGEGEPAPSPSELANAFKWALHYAAIERWSSGALAGAECSQDEIARQNEALIVELDELAAALQRMVADYVRLMRPGMAAPARQRVALRAAQVGVLRLAFGQTYAQIEAQPNVHGGLRSLESAYALMVDAYLAAWRCQRLPSSMVPVAGSPP